MARIQARNLVWKYRCQIEDVAKALVERRTLSGEEVKQVFRDPRQREYEAWVRKQSPQLREASGSGRISKHRATKRGLVGTKKPASPQGLVKSSAPDFIMWIYFAPSAAAAMCLGERCGGSNLEAEYSRRRHTYFPPPSPSHLFFEHSTFFDAAPRRFLKRRNLCSSPRQLQDSLRQGPNHSKTLPPSCSS
jgi:hypothetical protein